MRNLRLCTPRAAWCAKAEVWPSKSGPGGHRAHFRQPKSGPGGCRAHFSTTEKWTRRPPCAQTAPKASPPCAQTGHLWTRRGSPRAEKWTRRLPCALLVHVRQALGLSVRGFIAENGRRCVMNHAPTLVSSQKSTHRRAARHTNGPTHRVDV